MTLAADGIDPVLLAEFIDESRDNLQQVADLFVALEAEPDNTETIQAIFRPVHSIKGNAAYFGLLRTKDLAHEMETVLDLMRKGALSPTTVVTNVLLRGTDELRAMLGRARRGESEVADAEVFARLVDEVKSLVVGEKADEETLWRAVLAELRRLAADEAMVQARQLAQLSPGGRKALGDAPLSGVVPAPPQVRELAALLSNRDVKADPETVQSLLETCRQAAAMPRLQRLVDEALGNLEAIVESIGLDDPLARDMYCGYLEQMAAAGEWRGDSLGASPDAQPGVLPPPTRAESAKPERNDNAAAPRAPSADDSASRASVGKTMRIPEESIDVFLSHIGELVTVGEMYSHVHGNLVKGLERDQAAAELRRVNDAFRSLSRSLQTSIMNIRKVPMSGILQRAPRIIRDVATAKGKDIDVRVVGGDIMADKSLVDALESPLAHIARNAADHGVEMPDDRKAAGKPAKGTVEILAVESSEEITLTIRDDGRGINREALREKAVAMGLIKPSDALTDDGVVDLLFHSGVSTATEVTDVSGRGVGMDVVKRSIERMGGRIVVASEPGRGSEFVVRLPKTVTTQILNGFIVVVQGRRYVFPLECVARALRPAPSDLMTMRGRPECVRDGDRFLRVCRLGEHFGEPGPDGTPNQAANDDVLRHGVLVVVEAKDESIAVHVDDIEGVRQVVLREASAVLEKGALFLGAALMGDGGVALVVDVEEVAKIGRAADASPGGPSHPPIPAPHPPATAPGVSYT